MKIIQVGSSSGPNRIAQACDRCRAKKIKCNGDFPACSQCRSVGFDCKTSDKLRRKAFPRGYTESLEGRVRKLETENKELKEQLDERDEKIDVLSQTYTSKDIARPPISTTSLRGSCHEEKPRAGDGALAEYRTDTALQLPGNRQGDGNTIVQRGSTSPAVNNFVSFPTTSHHRILGMEAVSPLCLTTPEDVQSPRSSTTWSRRSEDACFSFMGSSTSVGLSDYGLPSVESTPMASGHTRYGASNLSLSDVRPSTSRGDVDRVCKASSIHAPSSAFADLGCPFHPALADLGHLALSADSTAQGKNDAVCARSTPTASSFPFVSLNSFDAGIAPSSLFASTNGETISAFALDKGVARPH